jgi:hypothetical protein
MRQGKPGRALAMTRRTPRAASASFGSAKSGSKGARERPTIWNEDMVFLGSDETLILTRPRPVDSP